MSMKKDDLELITGNEAAVLGAIAAGAEVFFGYPITPASEILQGWIEAALKDNSLSYLQTEDETSAGFAACGSIIGGKKTFTASAGPGHVLLQDPVSMAENLRLPFVGIMMQRGGPSTGTVNFSQQEVNLASFGGNGEGLRFVYSASSVVEMFTLTAKSFDTAWKYNFPTTVLGDGYLGKMQEKVKLPTLLKPHNARNILGENIKRPTFLRNCYSSEEQFGEVLRGSISDWNLAKSKVAESETFKTSDAEVLLVAHGLVAAAAKEAVENLRRSGVSAGLFRPITVHPIDKKSLLNATKNVKKIHLFESSQNQFSRIIKYELYGSDVPIVEHSKPAEAFSPEEIESAVK